jgi:hypothetical protein
MKNLNLKANWREPAVEAAERRLRGRLWCKLHGAAILFSIKSVAA